MITLKQDNFINNLNIDYNIIKNEKFILQSNINVLNNNNNKLELEYNRINFYNEDYDVKLLNK